MNNVAVKSILLITVMFLLTGCSYQSGSSTDIPYGWDSGFLWDHLYLTNDHKTVYCFDDSEVRKVLEEAERSQKKVRVVYNKYIFRGFLCYADEKYEKVVVTDIELVNEEPTAKEKE